MTSPPPHASRTQRSVERNRLRPDRRQTLIAVCIAIGVLGVGLPLIELMLAVGWMPWWETGERLAVVLVAAVVLVGRRFPMPTLVAVVAVSAATWFVTSQSAPALLLGAVLLSAYFAARWSSHPVWAAVLGTTAAAMPVLAALVYTAGNLGLMAELGDLSMLTGNQGMLASRQTWGSFMFDLLAVSAALVSTLLGSALQRADREASEAMAANLRLQFMRDQDRQRAIAEDRVAISRDVHDIVAHNVTAMVLRAQSAEHVAAVRPEVAVEALADIREAGTEALESLRDVLASLRADGDDARPFEAELQQAVHRASSTGLAVTTDLDPTVVVEPTTAGALLRIASEALTNTLRHSTGRRAMIRLGRVDGDVVLAIDDDGTVDRSRAEDVPGSGLGMRGMAERVRALGGSLRTGWREPAIPRGWFVEVRVPDAAPPVAAGPSAGSPTTAPATAVVPRRGAPRITATP